jgi:flagellar biosynthetic protein FliR
MEDLLADLIGRTEDHAYAGFLIFLRTGAMAALMPGLGEFFIPMRVRLAVSLAYAALLLPVLGPDMPTPANFGAALPPMLAEVAAGLMLGLALRLTLLAVQITGSLIAQSTSLSQMFGPMGGPEPVPAFGGFLIVSATLLAVANGLHVKAALVLLGSYRTIPPGTLPDAVAIARWATSQAGALFGLGLSLAGPVILAYFLLNLVQGAMTRAMPAMMVTFVAAPALALAGIGLLFLLLPVMLASWFAVWDRVLAAPLEAWP